MKLLPKLSKRSNRILFALIIGIIFACGAFFMQHRAEPLATYHVNPEEIRVESRCEIETLYNGINQVKMTGYSVIEGVNSKNTEISVIAIPENSDIYSGYMLPGYQYQNDAPIQIFGSGQDYSNAGFVADCQVSQIPNGIYYIGILTTVSDGSVAYSVTGDTFESGLYEDVLSLLFFITTFAAYFFCAFLCLELLYRKKADACTPPVSDENIPSRHSFLSIFNIVFLIMFFWIFLNVTFANIDSFANIENFKTLFSVWGAAVIFIGMYSLWKGVDFSSKPTVKSKIWIALGCIAFFLFQLTVCNSLSGQIRSFDSSQIAESARTFVVNGTVTYNQHYFVVYPHNYFMLFTDIGLYKLAGGSQSLFEQLSYLVNIIFLDTAILLSYLSIKDLSGRRVAAVMLLPLGLIIGLNTMMNMFYTDILSMVFSVLIFFLYLKLRKTKKIGLKALLLVLIALSAYVGYQYKITSVLILAAIITIELICHIKDWRKVLRLLVSCIIVLGIFFTLNVKTKEYTDQAPLLNISLEENPDLESFPFWHWVMVGLHYPYGEITQEDWDFTITRPKATRETEVKRVILQRLSQYGPAGYLSFLNDKAIFAFGESTFSIGNGDFGNEYTMPGSLFSKLLQDVFGSNGKWFPLFAYTLQGAWVLCLFLIIFPLFLKNKKKTDMNASILRLSLMILLAYLLVSENNTRQLISNLPLIMILASFSLNPVMNACKKLAEKAASKTK